MFVRRTLLATGLGALALLGGAAVPARGEVVYDSGGFEIPRFVPGEITNQDPVQGPWQKSGTNTSTGTIQTGTVRSGLQALQVTRQASPAGDARWAVLKPVANAVLVAVDWDMNVQQSSLTSGFGPFIGVEAYDALENNPLLAGSLGVDATTGDVLFQEAASGALVETGVTVPFNTWNSFRLLLDYETDQYSIFVNNVLLATEGFVDPGVDDFTDAPVAVLAAGGDAVSLSAAGLGYVDNYTIQHVVPEPSLAGCVLLIGVLHRATSRRRRA